VTGSANYFNNLADEGYGPMTVRAHNAALGYTQTFGAATVMDLRVGINRFSAFRPSNGLVLLGHKTSTLPASRPERTLRRYDTTSCQGTLRTRGLFHAAAGRYPVAVIYDGQADCFVPKCRGRKKEAGDTRWSVSLEGIATACCRGCQKEQVSCRGESRASRVTCGCLARLAALPTACIDEVDFDTNAHAEEHPQ